MAVRANLLKAYYKMYMLQGNEHPHASCLHLFPDCPFAQNDKFCQSTFISLCSFLTGLKKEATATGSPIDSLAMHELAINRLECLLADEDRAEDANIDSDDESSVASTTSDFYQGSNSIHKLQGSS